MQLPPSGASPAAFRPDPALRLHDDRVARLDRERAGDDDGDERARLRGIRARDARWAHAEQMRAAKAGSSCSSTDIVFVAGAAAIVMRITR